MTPHNSAGEDGGKCEHQKTYYDVCETCGSILKEQQPAAESVNTCICGEEFHANHACRGFKLRERISDLERQEGL